MPLTLYDNQRAPNPRRARIFIAEKGIEVESIEVDLRNREQLSDTFRSVNPRCTVPVLVTPEGQSITENLAIADYLEQCYPSPPLMGTNPSERAEVLTWNAICEQDGIAAIAEVLRNQHKAFSGRAMVGALNIKQIPDLVERGHQRWTQFLQVLDSQLQGRTFLATNDFSLADITAYISLEFSRMTGMFPDDPQMTELTNLETWLGTIQSRPSLSE